MWPARQALHQLHRLITAIAAISLIIGGIGVANVTLFAIREIGLRRAIGARRRDIVAQFLMEATVLSVIGGLLGVANQAAAPTPPRRPPRIRRHPQDLASRHRGPLQGAAGRSWEPPRRRSHVMIISQPNAPADRRATADLPSGGWLTAALRPAGTLDGASAAAFGRLLSDLAATADMVVVDLDATSIPDPAAFVETLWPAAASLAGPGKCLLLANAPIALEIAVNAAGVPAATLAADTVLPSSATQGQASHVAN